MATDNKKNQPVNYLFMTEMEQVEGTDNYTPKLFDEKGQPYEEKEGSKPYVKLTITQDLSGMLRKDAKATEPENAKNPDIYYRNLKYDGAKMTPLANVARTLELQREAKVLDHPKQEGVKVLVSSEPCDYSAKHYKVKGKDGAPARQNLVRSATFYNLTRDEHGIVTESNYLHEHSGKAVTQAKLDTSFKNRDSILEIKAEYDASRKEKEAETAKAREAYKKEAEAKGIPTFSVDGEKVDVPNFDVDGMDSNEVELENDY